MGDRVELGSVVDILSGHPFSSSGYVTDPGGTRVLRGDNIGQGVLRWKGAKRWPDGGPGALERYRLEVGDVVLAMDRPWIEAGLKYAEVGKDDVPSHLGQRVARLRARPGLDQRFLRYLVGSPGFTDYVLGVQTGTAVPHISGPQIKEFTVRLPAQAVQRSVAAVLGALDDKVAVNGKVVERCDEVRALALADHLRSPGTARAAAPLSSVAVFVNGRAFTRSATGTGRMVIRISELTSGPGGSTVHNDIDVPENHLARPGDILFAWSGSLTAARWFRPEAIVNQHIFKVLPRPDLPTWLVYELIRSKLGEFRRIAAGKATTMGHIQRAHLDEPVLVPVAADIPRLDAELGPLWDRALAAEQENLALTRLRDTLLPALMSGRLRVAAATEIVEGSA